MKINPGDGYKHPSGETTRTVVQVIPEANMIWWRSSMFPGTAFHGKLDTFVRWAMQCGGAK